MTARHAAFSSCATTTANNSRTSISRTSRGGGQALSLPRCVAIASDTMPTHRFKIGQTVFLSPSLGLNVVGGAYIVTRQCQNATASFCIE
jgi:hypothetical protein